MRKRVVLIVVLGATLLVGLLYKPNEPRPAQARARADAHAVDTSRPPTIAGKRTMAVAAKTVVQAPQHLPSPPVVTSFPSSLAGVELSDRQRAMLSRFSPLQRALYDYKLGLLARVRPCVAALGETSGALSLFLHFEVDANHGVARGGDADLINSNLARELDAAVLTCLHHAHREAELPLTGLGAEGLLSNESFHWSTEIVFPLDDDPAYELFTLSSERGETEEEG